MIPTPLIPYKIRDNSLPIVYHKIYINIADIFSEYDAGRTTLERKCQNSFSAFNN